MVTSSTEGGSRVRCWEKTPQERFAIAKEANKVLRPFVLERIQEEDSYNGLESNSPVITGPAEYPEISEPSAQVAAPTFSICEVSFGGKPRMLHLAQANGQGQMSAFRYKNKRNLKKGG